MRVYLLITICIMWSCGGNATEGNKPVLKSGESKQQGKLLGKELTPLEEYTKPNDFVDKYVFLKKEQLKIDLDGDSKLDIISFHDVDSLKLKSGKTVFADEAGDFLYVAFSLTKKNRKDTFLLPDGWIKKLFLYDVEMDKPRVKTDYAEIYQSGENNLLILEGFVYGNSATTQTIINIYDGVPELVFNKDERIKSIKTKESGEIELITSKKVDKEYTGGDIMYKVNKWLLPN